MQNLPKPFADGARPADGIDCISRLREDWHIARTAHSDLEMMRVPRANLLLKGTQDVIENVVDLLMPDLRAPITTWLPGDPLALPAVPAGTMILRDVGRLPLDDQCRLLSWLDVAGGRAQIVSTTPSPLLSRVRAGGFLDTLYYRLNTVCVDLSA
jgi:hypothetical protein